MNLCSVFFQHLDVFVRSVIGVGASSCHAFCLQLLCPFLFLTLFGFLKETLELLLLSHNLEKLKNHWHIVVASTLVFCTPICLTLLLSFNLGVLYCDALLQLGEASLESLDRLASQSANHITADLVGA